MNWDTISGRWTQMTGYVREKWGELTDDEITEMNGEREKMVGQIQAKYGIAREEAEQQVDEWAEGVKKRL